MKWRLGIDLGTNSIGWAVVELDESYEPCEVIKLGARIFSDGREPKTGESLAVARRNARGARRNRDRRNLRIRSFADCLKKYNLNISLALCPYEARSLAVSEKVNKETLARALFHLCQHRGFKSNRKISNTDKEDKEDTERKQQISLLRHYLAEHKISLGQFLYGRHKEGLPVRFRSGDLGVKIANEGENLNVYSDRAMYFEEFLAIRHKQGNTFLKEDAWNELERILFFQRPLKPQEAGSCEFEQGEKRASKSLPISQRIRIIQEVNNLRYFHDKTLHVLNQSQRNILIAELEKKSSLKFSAMRKLLKLDADCEFNLEDRKELMGNKSSFKMAKLFKEYDYDWNNFSLAEQNTFVKINLNNDESDRYFEEIKQENVEKWQLPLELIEKILDMSFPVERARLSEKAMEKILLHLEEGKLFYEAATLVYGGHTHLRETTSEVMQELPYYGAVLPKITSPIRKTNTSQHRAESDEEKHGKISNPTVHVALNQLRRVVNRLIVLYGNPYDIHIELARDLKLNKKEKEKLHKHNKEQEKRNIQYRDELLKCGIEDPSGNDFIKMRLWYELAPHGSGLGRVDIYTGKCISLTECMSPEIEIEHILPFSRTYDNTFANKSITFKYVNQEKGNDTPYEYARKKGGTLATKIMERAEQLKKSKKWRFSEKAMDIYSEASLGLLRKLEIFEHFEKGDQMGFLARQLKDTQYISVVAAKYLIPVVGEPSRVIPVKGGMTALLRGKWGLDFAKNKNTDQERNDHRHHAIDALVVALASRSLIKRIAEHSQKEQEINKDYSKIFTFMPSILKGQSRVNLHTIYEEINISYKPDHSVQGTLYAESAYGIINPEHPDYDRGNGVIRRAITALKETEVEKIRDKTLQAIISNRLEELKTQGISKYEERIAQIAREGVILGKQKQKITSVRILIKNQSIKAIPSANYKGYAPDSFAFCDIWHVPEIATKGKNKGKFTGKFSFQGSFVPFVDAIKYHNNDAELFKLYKPHPAAKHCMRLFKEDMVLWQCEVNGQVEEVLSRVAGYSTTRNQIDLRKHNQAGQLKDNFISINKLMTKGKMQKVRVGIDGGITILRR